MLGWFPQKNWNTFHKSMLTISNYHQFPFSNHLCLFPMPCPLVALQVPWHQRQPPGPRPSWVWPSSPGHWRTKTWENHVTFQRTSGNLALWIKIGSSFWCMIWTSSICPRWIQAMVQKLVDVIIQWSIYEDLPYWDSEHYDFWKKNTSNSCNACPSMSPGCNLQYHHLPLWIYGLKSSYPCEHTQRKNLDQFRLILVSSKNNRIWSRRW